ncbi:hypothetical protein [Actinomadura atramentaria]|uniref:hypothetical protein n=1 Tax=Actinomadura atramentaria TaxID=1990 RepID=UPI000365AEFB|nr:hypothetical protein [Actinomadura atramentaria]
MSDRAGAKDARDTARPDVAPGSSGGRGVDRTSSRPAAVAAALLLALSGLAACGGEERPRARPAPLPSVPEPVSEPLTPQVADREFRTYVADEDVARASGDERLALSWTSDGQSALTAAEFRRAAFDGDPVRRFTYGKPKLWVPKLKEDVYPQWFVASVPRTVAGKPKSTGTALMAFMRRSAETGWRLSFSTELRPKAKPPKVVVDAQGYAEPLATTDETVLIRPREVPGIQATMASEGPDSVAAKVMKKGDLTSGYYKQTRKERKKAADKKFTRQIVFVATPYPYFSLRTEHGGGLVLYSLFRNSVTRGDVENPKIKPAIPGNVAHLLDGTVEGVEIDVTEAYQYAVTDPARAKKGKAQPKADVVGSTGAPVKANTPKLKD